MESIAIITARGGSKRIPKKNIRDFCGKPIIAYSIEAAIESRIYDEVMVSTDSEEIARVAEKYGACVPFFRSKATSGDFATTVDVIIEVIEEYKVRGKSFDFIVCIYPTAPFITASKLVAATNLLIKKKADAVISVVRYSFPPQRAFMVKNDRLEYQYPQYENVRSQDLEPIYHDCGQFYICTCDGLLRQRSLILPNTIPFIIPDEEVQDIDTMSDWIIAEAKYKALYIN